ncbi:MAG: FAD binding domain-containing protein [Alphaproteobacteria bacterium]|nr:FAD binding domain-containing protein [Alphaproteobacteria bacterium]
MAAYFQPRNLQDALSAMNDGRWTVLAGGTDHFPARVTHVPDESLLDVTAVPELRGISHSETGIRIGAATTWTDLVEAALPAACAGLTAAAREVGGIQIQNRGTIGGNVCNASPAADGIPALLSLDAQIELASLSGHRTLPLSDFVIGNRTTTARPDELLVALHLPATALTGQGAFVKLGARRYLVISIVMVAGTLDLADDGTIETARIAIGACSAVALRMTALEAALIGARPAEALERLDTSHFAGLSPIEDPRGDPAYRNDAALTLTRRCLARLAEAA